MILQNAVVYFTIFVYDIMSLKEKQVAASRHLFFWAH